MLAALHSEMCLHALLKGRWCHNNKKQMFDIKFVCNWIFAKYIGSLQRNRRKKEKHKRSVPQKQGISLLTTSSVGVTYF